jgi:hypothetical protein
MMDEKIKQHLISFNTKEGYPIDDKSLIETLSESSTIYTEDYGSHRWWNDEFRVVEIDGMFIGYIWGVTTGDDSAENKGWKFDVDSIMEIDRKERIQVYYEKK